MAAKEKVLRKVIHIVPVDGIGGVESAAETMRGLTFGRHQIVVKYIYDSATAARRLHSPLAILCAAMTCARSDVDIVIASLWRGALAGVLAKVLRPRIKLVLFLHASQDMHIIDAAANRLAMIFASEVWADSAATQRRRFGGARAHTTRVISFLARRQEPVAQGRVSPHFIYWGRINAVKRLDRALAIFALVRRSAPAATFTVIGPDDGDLAKSSEVCAALGLSDVVAFIGPATQAQIRMLAADASFFLQTSETEGMAMAVSEAMQLGLVPIVTSVGEIASYCQHLRNAIIVSSPEATAECVADLLQSDDRYQELRRNAMETWRNKRLYRESVVDACNGLLTGDR